MMMTKVRMDSISFILVFLFSDVDGGFCFFSFSVSFYFIMTCAN
jgi:hypothetical protein